MMVDEKADLMFDGLFDHIDDLLDFSNEDDFMVDGFSSSSTGMATCCHKQEIGTSGCAQSQMVSAPPPLLLLPLSLPQDNDTYTNTTPLSCCTGPVSTAATAQPLQEEDPIIDPLDIKQLEWLSDFFEDSFTPSACIDLITHSSNYSKAGSHNNNNNKEKEEEESQFRTSSPVSVLEPTNHGGVIGAVPSYSTALFPPSSASPTSSACSGVGSVSSSSSSTGVRMMLAPDHLSAPEILVVPGRARTKRPRPATFNPRSRHMLTPPLLDGPTPTHLVPHSDSGESFAESKDPLRYGVPGVKKNNKKKKNTNSSIITATSDGGDNNELAFPAVRKCMHCEIQKTPQWRAGPMGPKTLCNACGVRYKSGRLFPEYRPAASPTFVPTLHSNSHKKVVEMRNQIITQKPPQAQEVKGLLDYIRRLE